MKKYLFSSLFFLLVAAVASAQCDPASCTGKPCPPTCKPADCKPACVDDNTASCSSANTDNSTAWQGNITIDGKKYLASGKIYKSQKGLMAILSIADLKITKRVFAATRTKDNSYTFTAMKN